MSHHIFLSHNYNDKPVVEAVALRLAQIFGQDQVFYDSWSIQPGDGIIDKMNQGLEAPEFVFFFVSQNSLSSSMVKLEWQNALYTASKGKTRIIPVRVDGADMPAILQQNLYIDMYTVGLEAAITQIVGVAQGNASFTPQHLGFSNLSYTQSTSSDGTIDITIKASHLMEPNPNFALVVINPESEIGWSALGAFGVVGGFNASSVPLEDGSLANAIVMRPMNAVLTPGHSVKLRLTKRGDVAIGLIAVLHEKTENNWIPVPKDSSAVMFQYSRSPDGVQPSGASLGANSGVSWG